MAIFEKSKKPIDAILHKASVHEIRGKKVITGIIEADSKGRFCDGEFVRTSIVQSIHKNIVHTLNTTYFISSWIERAEEGDEYV